MKITLHWRSEPCGLEVTISARYDWSVTGQSTSIPLRHWNLRNLTLLTFLSNTRDFSACTLLSHGSIMLPLRSLEALLGWLVGSYCNNIIIILYYYYYYYIIIIIIILNFFLIKIINFIKKLHNKLLTRIKRLKEHLTNCYYHC